MLSEHIQFLYTRQIGNGARVEDVKYLFPSLPNWTLNTVTYEYRLVWFGVLRNVTMISAVVMYGATQSGWSLPTLVLNVKFLPDITPQCQ